MADQDDQQADRQQVDSLVTDRKQQNQAACINGDQELDTRVRQMLITMDWLRGVNDSRPFLDNIDEQLLGTVVKTARLLKDDAKANQKARKKARKKTKGARKGKEAAKVDDRHRD